MLIDHAYPEIECDLKNDLLVQSHMSNDSLKQLARYHPNHPEPKKVAKFFGFFKDANYADPDPVNHQNWRNEEEMKEAAYAEELKVLEDFKGTRNDWFVKELRKRGKKVTPKSQEGEGSSAQPKKKQKKVAKTLLINEPEVEEPTVNVEENPYVGIEEVILDVDDVVVEQAASKEAQKEKVTDDIEGDDVDKDTTSSSSSSDDEVDETEHLRRIQEATEKEKLLRKRKRQEKEDAPYVPSPQHVSGSQSPPLGGRKKVGARKKVVSPKIRKVTPKISRSKIVLKKKPAKEPTKPPTPPPEPTPHQSPIQSTPHQSPPQQPSPPRQLFSTKTTNTTQTTITVTFSLLHLSPPQPVIQTTPGSSGYKGFPVVPSNLDVSLDDVGDFDFANAAQVKNVEKKVDEVIAENKKLTLINQILIS
ncbi:hypothetical protein HanPI659440_Chr09g0314931 [Helianthus annuus]|nr:hypothetical protein HanPI659440_Chr09g0314931 [Helianthus annuus]